MRFAFWVCIILFPFLVVAQQSSSPAPKQRIWPKPPHVLPPSRKVPSSSLTPAKTKTTSVAPRSPAIVPTVPKKIVPSNLTSDPKRKMLAVMLDAGFEGNGLHIKKERIVIGEVVDDHTIKLPVIGGLSDHVQISLGPKARIVSTDPRGIRAVTKEDILHKDFGPNSNLRFANIPKGTNSSIKETVIKIDEHGNASMMYQFADVSIFGQNAEPLIPIDKMELLHPTISAGNSSWYDWLGVSQNGGVLDATARVSSKVLNDVIAIPQRVYESCKQAGGGGVNLLKPLYAFTSKEIGVPANEPRVVNWDEFYEYLANQMGNPINNCKNSEASGTLALENAEMLSKKVYDNLLRDKILPKKNYVFPPEKAGEIDICARTCLGEMQMPNCYTKNGQFYPMHYKAVVASAYNRTLMVANKSENPKEFFSSAVFIPSDPVDARQFRGANDFDLMKGLTGVTLIGRQYNAWKSSEENAQQTSFCPSRRESEKYEEYKKNPNLYFKRHPEAKEVAPPQYDHRLKNPEYLDFQRNPNLYFQNNPKANGIPPPEYKNSNPLLDQSFRSCAKYCAKVALQPEEFQKDLECKKVFVQRSYTSGYKANLERCYPIDKEEVLIKDDNGKCTNVNEPMCTRFWKSKEGIPRCLD